MTMQYVDGMIIIPGNKLTGNKVKSYGDHRIAMMLALASTKCIKDVKILNPDCVKISFPQFFQ